jgi:DNA-binding NarL/FixJ family response regulator
LVAQGYPINEIAERLAISAKTVETYRACGMEKVGLTTRRSGAKYPNTPHSG